MEKKTSTQHLPTLSFNDRFSKDQLQRTITAVTFAYALPTFVASLEQFEKLSQTLGLFPRGVRETLPGADHVSSFIFGALLMSYRALEESLTKESAVNRRQVFLFGGLLFATAVNTIGELLQHQPNPELPAEIIAGIGGSLAIRSLFRTDLINQTLTHLPRLTNALTHLPDYDGLP